MTKIIQIKIRVHVSGVQVQVMGNRLRANDRVFHTIDSDFSFNRARGERDEYRIKVGLSLGNRNEDIV